MVDKKIIVAFLKTATNMFPLGEEQHHNIILSDDGRLTVMILLDDIRTWWYCIPATDEEWINAKETLTTLKKAVDAAYKED